MAVTQVLVNYDWYYKVCEGPKIFVNHLDSLKLDDGDVLNEELMTTYESLEIDTRPSCKCRKLRSR